MTKSEKKLLLKMNKRMERFKKAGAESYIISQTKNMLLNFYLKHDITAPRSGRFTTRKGMTPEQEEELLRIARAMDRSKSSSIGYYKKHFEDENRDDQIQRSFESFQQNHPELEFDFADWVNYIDQMENEDKGFKDYYDSETILDIYNYGYSIGLKNKDIQAMMAKQLRYGKKTPISQRYDKTVARINKYYKEMQLS